MEIAILLHIGIVRTLCLGINKRNI